MTIAEIINWIKNYKINTHALGAFVLALPLFYQQNAQFHAAVNALWMHVPNGLRGLIVAAGPLWMLYRNSLKGAKQGTVLDIMNPTTGEVQKTVVVAQNQKSGLSGFGEK